MLSLIVESEIHIYIIEDIAIQELIMLYLLLFSDKRSLKLNMHA